MCLIGRCSHVFLSTSRVTISSGGPFAFCLNTNDDTVFHAKGYLTGCWVESSNMYRSGQAPRHTREDWASRVTGERFGWAARGQLMGLLASDRTMDTCSCWVCCLIYPGPQQGTVCFVSNGNACASLFDENGAVDGRREESIIKKLYGEDIWTSPAVLSNTSPKACRICLSISKRPIYGCGQVRTQQSPLWAW